MKISRELAGCFGAMALTSVLIGSGVFAAWHAGASDSVEIAPGTFAAMSDPTRLDPTVCLLPAPVLPFDDRMPAEFARLSR